ncbi:hypothetical protein [Spirosoma aerolatum]|uniref:hypothetical protein n=1 Tax=Spirosoma aerolatum TaxID=1211326 RepID=UPI0009AD7F52|nr:hypothetical protein [Spirosoma aerolatum]
MKTKWLFPHSYRLIGWLIFVPCFVIGIAFFYADVKIPFLTVPFAGWKIPGDVIPQNLTDEMACIGVIIGLMFIAFSREKTEDEMISQLRLEALQWSVYVNYLILAIAILTVYDNAFFNVMIYNMFTVLLVFIIRFRWLMSGSTILRYEKPTES